MIRFKWIWTFNMQVHHGLIGRGGVYKDPYKYVLSLTPVYIEGTLDNYTEPRNSNNTF